MKVKSKIVPSLQKLILLGAFLTGVHSSGLAFEASSEDEKALVALIKKYPANVNASDSEGYTNLFTTDAVRLAPGRNPESGHDTIKSVVEIIMERAALNVSIDIDELEVNGRSAWATGTINGDLTVKETNEKKPVGFKVLFVMKKSNEDWKIHRQIWNKKAE